MSENELPELEKHYVDAVLAVSDYLRLDDKYSDEATPAAAIFLVGGQSYSDSIHSQSVRAAELFNKGKASKIVITCKAGANAGNLGGRQEHEVYIEELTKLGVPLSAIVVDPRGNNTLTEAKGGLELMGEKGINLDAGLILTSTPVHSRRVRATWELIKEQMELPDLKLISCPGKEPIDPTNVEQVGRIYGEILRLIVYARQGNLKNDAIPDPILKAAATIRNHWSSSHADKFPQPGTFAPYLPKRNTI